MSITSPSAFKTDELERLIKSVEPAAFLVPPRLMRRVIKQDRDIGGLGLLLPHRQGIVVSREVLLRSVQPAELGLAANAELPPFAFLIVRFSEDRIAAYGPDYALVKHWRILFHLHIDHVMQRKLADGSLTTAMVRQRIQRLGLTEFAEITAVLGYEKYLLPPESIETVYAEFVAVYLTMRRFDPARLAHFFPTLHHREQAVDALAAQDIDADAIYDATRLPGAPEPAALAPRIRQPEGRTAPSKQDAGSAPKIGDDTFRDLFAQAEKLDAEGNALRAASLRTQAVERAKVPPAQIPMELSRLGDRLKKALELSDAAAENWRQALLPLVGHAVRGWSQEARFLYDLQSVCLDSERGIYTVDIMGCVMSLGQLSIKRRLPSHQEVAVVRHLRGAMGRIRFLRITDDERQRLLHLLEHALEQRELLMRQRFRPLLTTALDEVGLKAHNVAEEIGRAKLIEELLDRVVEQGHLNMGGLRDTISRNQMKLPDLSSPVELLLGDPLIRLNRKLAVSLDGVYRRGEFYMRLLHRLSSAFFGTLLGRLLVLYLILPFGLGFFTMITPGIAMEEGEKLAQLVGLMHKEEKTQDDDEKDAPWQGLEEWQREILRRDEGLPIPPAPVAHSHHSPLAMPSWWGVAGFGVFYLLLIHVGSFRSQVSYSMGRVGQALYTVFIEVPLWLVHLPALQAILHNRFWVVFRRFVFWPMLAAAAGGLIAARYNQSVPVSMGIAIGCLLLSMAIINSRLGRDLEETVTDWLLRFWVWLSIDFVPGLLRLIMDVSRWCLETIERWMYTVNEWLRFRSGENRIMIVIKALLGLIWFCVTYVIRFVINLLVEPQINPIKHFPVVTVSHKVCLPMTPALGTALIEKFNMPPRRAFTLATGIITSIPGIFGFMAWELKENWKLYASNRSRKLKPVLIGSHGETLLRLLRPGFHSGTVPKLFRKLRKAERIRKQRNVRKLQAELHHVAESVAHFIEREMLALLRQSKSWGGLAVELAHIHLATNRVAVELRCPALGEQPLLLAFDQRNDWLLAGVLETGWLPKLNDGQRQTLAAAFAGLYKMAGVHLTREQIAASLPATTFAFDVASAGLMVWMGADAGHDGWYDLAAGPELSPQPVNGSVPQGMPVLDTGRVLFSSVPLAWQDWVKEWQGDRVDGTAPSLLTIGLLPLANESRAVNRA